MTETKQDTITITVDGKAIECRPGELLIDVAKRGGVYIPYFCYHPRMDPVGACRMCLVHIQPGPPKPQTSCTTRVSDGMVVQTQFTNPDIHDAQKGVLEFLLINHPLDCPICDRGGECPLQDQTQDYGPAESRYVEPKRRFPKPVPISPLIQLDRERCILCYRCTRFCEELSGDTLIGVMERGSSAYIFPFEGEAFDSYFSGNTVQICPVGALTSNEYRFRARPWDLQNVPSTCDMCACGCSMHVSVRVQDGNVVRFSAATNDATNEDWLCDKGRYGNAYISSPDRLTQPLERKDGELKPISWDEAFHLLGERLRPVMETGNAGMIVGESVSDEDAYAAQKFARVVLQTNNVDHRIEGGPSADALVTPSLTYDDLVGTDLAVLVGLDAREELPILFLRLRIAATKRGLRVALVHQRDVALSEYAAATLSPFPGTEAAVARALQSPEGAEACGLSPDEVRAFADALASAKRPVILLGPRMFSPDVVRAWRAVAYRTGAKFGWAPRRANTYGALAAGAHPELLPGWRRVDDDHARGDLTGAWGSVPDAPGLDVHDMLQRAADGELDVLWLVGADVLDDVPAGELGRRALEGAPFVVVQDVHRSPLLDHADLVLPAAAFVEREGTLTNWEGRRQPMLAAVDPPGAARADYAILAEAARRLGRSIGCRTAAATREELDQLLESSPGAADDVPGESTPAAPADQASLKLLTYHLLYDDGSRIKHTGGIRELTPGAFVELHPTDAERAGITDGQKTKVTSAHGSVTARAQLSKSIREGIVFVPWTQWGVTARALLAWDDRHPVVTVEPA
jgi:NADH-quinone oxidoreductase subunit G